MLDQPTDVTGANFSGADLRGADLSHVQGLTLQQISGAIIDETTVLSAEMRALLSSNV